MLATPSCVCVYNTGTRQHIDAVSVAPSPAGGGAASLAAISTSSLTGDVWDGSLVILDRLSAAGEPQPARVAASAPTPSGVADVAWLSLELLATGNDRGDVTLWQLQTRDESSCSVVAIFGEHTQPITSLAGSASPRIASTSLDGTAKVWSAAVAGGCTTTLDHLPLRSTWGEVPVHSACWLDASAQQLATGASDGVVRLWDVRQPSPAATRCAPHTAPLLTLAAGANESQVLAGSECGVLLLLDTRKLDAPVASAQVHAEAPLCALSVAPLSEATMAPCAAAASEDGSVALLDPRDLHALSVSKPHGARVGGLGWVGVSTGGGGILLSGGWDNRLVRQEWTAPSS